MLYLIYGLLALAIVIAILGVINTLALSVIERTREIGLLRRIGTSRLQIRRLVRLESVLIAIHGALLGLGLGLAWGAAGQRVLSRLRHHRPHHPLAHHRHRRGRCGRRRAPCGARTGTAGRPPQSPHGDPYRVSDADPSVSVPGAGPKGDRQGGPRRPEAEMTEQKTVVVHGRPW